MNNLCINVDGIEKSLPAGVDILDNDLYNVPFDLLSLAEEGNDEEYHWVNPRRLGEIEGLTKGAGLDKCDMEELYADIKDDGLMFPLICRWIINNGELAVQLLDGERRWRCIDRQRKKEDKVWSRKDKVYLLADEVYAKVPCRIIVGNDKEALKIAFMVSDRSVSWGEGATAKLIKKLRKHECSDEEIIELTKKSFQWLREMDEICNLDEITFSYLSDDRINRALALRLSKIEDVDRRHWYLHGAYDDAVATHREEVSKADEALERAENREEVAEAELEEAKLKGDEEATEEAVNKFEKAQASTQSRRRQRREASRPRGKTKNLRNFASKVAGEEEEEIEEAVLQVLSPGKIKKQQEEVQALVTNGAKDDEDKELFTVPVLQVVLSVYKAILTGEEDIIKVLKRQRSSQKLQSMKKPPPDIVADMQAE